MSAADIVVLGWRRTEECGILVVLFSCRSAALQGPVVLLLSLGTIQEGIQSLMQETTNSPAENGRDEEQQTTMAFWPQDMQAVAQSAGLPGLSEHDITAELDWQELSESQLLALSTHELKLLVSAATPFASSLWGWQPPLFSFSRHVHAQWCAQLQRRELFLQFFRLKAERGRIFACFGSLYDEIRGVENEEYASPLCGSVLVLFLLTLCVSLPWSYPVGTTVLGTRSSTSLPHSP